MKKSLSAMLVMFFSFLGFKAMSQDCDFNITTKIKEIKSDEVGSQNWDGSGLKSTRPKNKK